MKATQRICIQMDLDLHEYMAVRRALKAIAASDLPAAKLLMEIEGSPEPPSSATDLGTLVVPVHNPAFPPAPPAPAVEEIDPMSLPRPKPIDPSTLPADDPRRVEAELLSGRWGGPTAAPIDHSPD